MHRFALSTKCSGCLFALWFPISSLAEELRPLSTDRPDTTESPLTVDAGHFQFEFELGALSRDGDDRTFSLAEMNAKVGLGESTDLQLVLPFYTHVRNGGEGFGDVEIRLKRNLWGNDEADTALALMPFVKVPTANGDLGNGAIEGGLIVPYGFEAPAGWACAVMGELDVLEDEDGSGHHAEFLASATASHSLSENTGAFFECVGIFSEESGADWQAYFNTGITWALKPQCQIDFGVRVGLTDASEDVTPFAGFSLKL